MTASKKRTTRKPNARRLKDLPPEDMAAVNGGISRALHNSNERAKHAFQKIGRGLEAAGKAVIHVVGEINPLIRIADGKIRHESGAQIVAGIGNTLKNDFDIAKTLIK